MRAAADKDFLRRLGGSWRWQGTVFGERKVAGWNPPKQKIKAALELIQPMPERRAQCERQLIKDFDLVLSAKVVLDGPGWAKANKGKFRKFAKTLRAIEVSGIDLYIRPWERASFMKMVKKYREEFDDWTDRIGKDKKKRSYAKQDAADCAHKLLAKYGSRPPTLTRGGTWDNLATTLYDEGGRADLFDYLRRSPHHEQRKNGKNQAIKSETSETSH